MDYSDPYPADAEQFMILEIISGDVEHINEQMKEMMSNTVNIDRLQKDVEKMETAMQDMMSNTVNIKRLQKDVEKILSDIEKLKDKQRTFANGDVK